MFLIFFLAQKFYTKIFIDRRVQLDDRNLCCRPGVEVWTENSELTRVIACHFTTWVGEFVANLSMCKRVGVVVSVD